MGGSSVMRRGAFGLLLFVYSALLLVAESASAWGCEGHMLVAQVAKHHLHKNASLVMDRAMSAFSASGPFPKAADMMQAACWMDDIKGMKQLSMNKWHYISYPYYHHVHHSSEEQSASTSASKTSSESTSANQPPLEESWTEEEWDLYSAESETPLEKSSRAFFTKPGTLKPLEVEKENIRTKLLSMVNSISQPKALPHYMIELALVQILHLIGDIHQPLHCASLVSEYFPDGDTGGNDIIVLADGVHTKLHSLWDNICDTHLPKFKRPLTAESKRTLEEWALKLEKRYGERVAPLAPSDAPFSPKTFALESHYFAMNTSYSDGIDAYRPKIAPAEPASRTEADVAFTKKKLGRRQRSHSRSAKRRRARSPPAPAETEEPEDDAATVAFSAMAEDNSTSSTTFLKGTDEEMVLSHHYIKKCRSVARQRIVLAGLRLANILNKLFEEIPPAYQNEDKGKLLDQ